MSDIRADQAGDNNDVGDAPTPALNLGETPAPLDLPGDPPAKPGVGERLRAAREAEKVSLGEMAAALKLSARQVEALEAGDWEKLPGHAFVRGFIRNYARVLNIPSEPLLADLDVPSAPPLRIALPQAAAAVMPEAVQRKRRSYAIVLVGAALVLLALLAYFFAPPNFWLPESVAPSVEQVAEPDEAAEEFALLPEEEEGAALEERDAASPASPDAAAPAATKAEPAKGAEKVEKAEKAAKQAEKQAEKEKAAPKDAAKEVAKDLAKNQAKETAKEAPKEAAKAEAPPAQQTPTQPIRPADAAAPVTAAPASASASFQLSFAEPSWVEVRDAKGAVIFSQLNAAGSEQVVRGEPPFALVVGNASQVRLRYKGEEIELAPRSRDDVARLNLK